MVEVKELLVLEHKEQQELVHKVVEAHKVVEVQEVLQVHKVLQELRAVVEVVVQL